MTETLKPVLGSFVKFSDLSPQDKSLVDCSWDAAERAYTPLSKFPVGAMAQVANEKGHTRNFFGCNVENRFMSCTICAERNALTTAVASGYRHLKKLALVLKLYQGPGASPCGPCRQVMIEFGQDAIVLQAADSERNVAQYLVRDLLPAASGELVPLSDVGAWEKLRIARLLTMSKRAYAPYSKRPRAAIFTAGGAKGHERSFAGLTDDNSAYGGSASAETVAMRTARTAGYARNPLLMLLVDDPKALNPVEGGSLQVLRECGNNGKVLLVGADGSSVASNVTELLPDSFGPESLV